MASEVSDSPVIENNPQDVLRRSSDYPDYPKRTDFGHKEAHLKAIKEFPTPYTRRRHQHPISDTSSRDPERTDWAVM